MPKASCCICRKTWSKEKIRLFHAPKNPNKRKTWSKSCGVPLNDSSRICENHFLESDFNTGNGDHSPKRRRLKPTAVPSSHFQRMICEDPKRSDDSCYTELETDFLVESKSRDESSSISDTSDWATWCRLCADEEPPDSSPILQDVLQVGRVEEETSDTKMILAVKKYFGVKIKVEDVRTAFCKRCCSLLGFLSTFSERVARAQQMFSELQNMPTEFTLNTHHLRMKYGLLSEEDHDIQEMQSIESESKSVVDLESEFKNTDQEIVGAECTDSTNPLENTSLAKEDMLDMIIDDLEECLSEFDQDAIEMVEETMDNIDFTEEPAIDEPKKETQDVIKGSEDEQELPNECQSNSIDFPRDDEYFEDFSTEDDEDQYDADSAELDNGPVFNYTCTDCSRQFTHHRHLRMHMTKAHSKTVALPELPCKQCSKVFPTPHQLEVHSKVHLPLEVKRTVPCPYCEKKFSSPSLVQLHIKFIHLHERPFICDECGTTVRTKTDLKSHMLTHTDYAPFECEVCKRAFKSTKRLKKHMEIHDPNKHICAECGLQLNSRATLTNHLAVHSDEMQHKCDYCGRAFKRAKALKNHLLIHTGLKPYSCEFCHRTFANASSCRSHKKRVHPAELSALEAAGTSKTYTKNIPKLETLKEIIKSMDNLTPVRERGKPKQSTCEGNEFNQQVSPVAEHIPKEQTSIVSVMAPGSAEAIISFTVALH